MFKKLACLLIITTVTIPVTIVADEDRLKIGLVLSGGGARGAAHAGVLRVLEELRIPIDYVAGTSMGSIVAGLYASGMTADEIATALTEMDWDSAMRDKIERRHHSVHRKREADRYSIPITPGFRDGQIQLQNAAIQGQNIILALQRFTDHVAHIKDFDTLSIPFRAVATDIITGRKVVIDNGNLATAMRASMAVPGVFAPVEYGEAMLVDGGISDNIPVDVAREMGADVVIVIDISTPLRKKDQLGNLLTITDQLTRLMTQQNGQAQLATLTDKDILLVPELGDITSSSFDRAGEAIDIGEALARENIVKLARLSIPKDAYDDYLASRPVINKPNRTILGYNLAHNTTYSDEVLTRNINIKTGNQLDLDQLEQDLTAIYGIGHFEHVGYELIQQSAGTDIQIRAIRRKTGPDYLHFGLEANSDSDGDSGLKALVGYTKTELNSTGGEWTSILAVGNDPTIETYLFQPIGKNLDFFFLPRATVKREKFNLYEDTDRIAEYKVREFEIAAGIGYEFGSRAAILSNLVYSSLKSEIQVGDPSLSELEIDIGYLELAYRYDTLDDIDFPSRGSLIRLSYIDAMESLGSDVEYSQWESKTGTVRTWNDFSLMFVLKAGGTDGGETEPTRQFRLGGYGNLTALKPDQLTGRQMGIAQVALFRRFEGIKFLPAFVGGLFEYGGAWDDWDDADTDSSIFSGTAFIAVDSPMGPAQVGMAFSDKGDQSFYIRIGRIF
jgi:NTE family protein